MPVKIKSTNNETFRTASGELTTRDMLRKFQIRGVPATFFLDGKGEPVFNVPGYVPDDIYETILRYIAEEHFKNQSFDEYQKNAKAGS